MMSELRWALLILGVVFIVVLAFWERRRPRQASGARERMTLRDGGAEPPPRLVREPPLTLPEVRVREPLAAAELPVLETGDGPTPPVLEPAEPEPGEALESPADAPPAYVDPVYAEEPPLEAARPREEEETMDDIPALVLDEQAGAREAADTRAARDQELPELPAHAPLLVGA